MEQPEKIVGIVTEFARPHIDIIWLCVSHECERFSDCLIPVDLSFAVRFGCLALVGVNAMRKIVLKQMDFHCKAVEAFFKFVKIGFMAVIKYFLTTAFSESSKCETE